jgi:hypothetical protein
LAAETSLDDQAYDAHIAVPADSAAAADSAAGSVADSETQQGDEQAALDSQQQQQQRGAGAAEHSPPVQQGHATRRQSPAQPANRSQFDRTVSLVFAEGDATLGKGGSSSKLGNNSRDSWRHKLSASYVRRAMSARFAGGIARGTAAASEQDSEEEGQGDAEEGQLALAGKGVPRRGKSGALCTLRRGPAALASRLLDFPSCWAAACPLALVSLFLPRLLHLALLVHPGA